MQSIAFEFARAAEISQFSLVTRLCSERSNDRKVPRFLSKLPFCITFMTLTITFSSLKYGNLLFTENRYLQAEKDVKIMTVMEVWGRRWRCHIENIEFLALCFQASPAGRCVFVSNDLMVE